MVVMILLAHKGNPFCRHFTTALENTAEPLYPLPCLSPGSLGRWVLPDALETNTFFDLLMVFFRKQTEIWVYFQDVSKI